jgi:hypothetical protein
MSARAFISGLRNCHLKGIDSLVLSSRESQECGMARVFFNRDCPDMANLHGSDGSYILAPHNHRQDIALYGLWGSATNVSFKVDRRTHDRYHTEFRFGSAIVDGKITAEYKDCVDLYLQDAAIIPRTGLSMSCRAVHTVLSTVGSAWLVVEGHTAPEGSESLCYSPAKNGVLVFDQAGLYQEMTPVECASMPRLYYDAMQLMESLK